MTQGPAGTHTAIVTGANHGIGAATAVALARRGCAVLCSYLRVEDPDDPGTPRAFGEHRRPDAGPVVARIQQDGGRAVAMEAD
ncbi:MAG: hypothetical protein WA895_07715, partial [Streptosporangiaceae bacterium]